ncbi:hypothetical protein M407DRAFT_23033 [Tulasnella calospora MUT 4182]|uniref:PARP catalytic domain-containing protein n=1 Tax=Tulasnella calospora MUT 4182 TaxID=1051891 RepID=A0A0C3QLW7_9AGAM|nr:hypothetical protein M407DRAFT_23033 [Tulasnella calospora MUT 4182]
MPTPKTHYRIALGENNYEHSWIIQSAKGIKWHNIPDELVTLLQDLSVNELLDFSLGLDGRWYVKYRQKGRETHELAPYLWKELGQGSNVKLDRLTLGPYADHWGVRRAEDGSLQPFSSIASADGFTRLLDSETLNDDENSKIDFVSLGFGGDWAFSINGHVEHRCGKPFQNRLADGQKSRKRVSTIVLSPMDRLWIIVWEDGSLSHNLPLNMATEVKDYCQLRYSLSRNSDRSDSGRPEPQKARHPRSDAELGTSSTSAQKQPPTANPTQATTKRSKRSARTNTTQPSSTQQTIDSQPNIMSLPVAPLPVQPPIPSNVEAASAEAEVCVTQKKLSTTLRLLDPSYCSDSIEHDKISRLFENGWKHPEKRLPKIKRILVVSLPDHLNESYQEYKDLLQRRSGLSGLNEQLVFHGTSRHCALGEGVEPSTTCEEIGCSLCCILKTSFLLSKAGSTGRSFKRFGPGIYTSNVSSKAHDYANSQGYSNNKAIIVAKVALGKSKVYTKTTKYLMVPPRGYDSIIGKPGVHLNYDEQVLYKNEAIRPAYIVIYEGPASAPA